MDKKKTKNVSCEWNKIIYTPPNSESVGDPKNRPWPIDRSDLTKMNLHRLVCQHIQCKSGSMKDQKDVKPMINYRSGIPEGSPHDAPAVLDQSERTSMQFYRVGHTNTFI